VHYTVTPDWLVEEGESTGIIDWLGGQVGVQSKRINIKPVSSSTDATISLSLQSGSAGIPGDIEIVRGAAVLHILNTN
jgi:hypothetical protein